MIGIIAYQGYVPRYRISSKEIKSIWGLSAPGVIEKSVPYRDEDTISMGVASTLDLFMNTEINLEDIEALYFASVSSPYIDKPVSTLLISMFGLRNDIFTTDIGGSAQSGVMALINCYKYLQNSNKMGLIIIADNLVAKPNSVLERSFGCGAVSLLVGNNNPIAEITGYATYSSEISDKWKGVNGDYKAADERFTREFGYIPVIKEAITLLIDKVGININEFDHIIIQQPNGKAPEYIAKALKFEKKKLQTGLIANVFGDLGSVSVFMGLAKVLDNAKTNEKILIAAYSSGGCHAVSLEVTPNISNYKSNPSVQYLIENKINIDYVKYLKLLNLI